MAYAYGANINHEYSVDHLNIWVTFAHPMRQTEDAVPLTPPLAKWLLEADEVAVALLSSVWLDEFTLLLTSDEVLAEPTGVTLEYAGPDTGLKTTWGKQWEPWGAIPSYAGYPTTPALHNSTHENGGSDEIQIDGLSGLLADTQHSYVDRGDPATYDFVKANLTQDDAWHDLDLSAIVPAGANAVLIRLLAVCTSVNKNVSFRKNGNSNTYNVSMTNTQVANVALSVNIPVACDSGRVIEYFISTGTWSLIGIVICGWWL